MLMEDILTFGRSDIAESISSARSVLPGAYGDCPPLLSGHTPSPFRTEGLCQARVRFCLPCVWKLARSEQKEKRKTSTLVSIWKAFCAGQRSALCVAKVVLELT